MDNFRKSVPALAVAASLGMAISAMAASNTQGGLIGHSVDSTGHAVAGVSITIKNLNTGLTRTAISDITGTYHFPLLPAGKYEVFGQQNGKKTIPINIGVRIGQNSNVDLSFNNNDIERIEIRGSALAMIDTSSAESVMVIDSDTIERLPVSRDITSVALLAPGVNQGDSAFEDDSKLASFAGSSVGENAYYINGLNTTNFRNGLGGSEVPFEFYEQFEVKNGGYGAEYGRSTGGVITAITKSGGNNTKFGISAFYEPDALSADKPNVYNPDGELVQVNDQDEADNYDFNIYTSGALIKDELFYYVLLNPRSRSSTYNSPTLGGTNYYTRNEETLFWGLNIDWYMNDDNIIELTAFSDERETDLTTYNWDKTTKTASNPAPSMENRGGLNVALKYTSIITDDLQISALAGLNSTDRTDSSKFDTTCPWIYDSREGGLTKMGCWATKNAVNANDERQAYRIDVDYQLGDHALRFGLDVEENTINNIEQFSAGRYYRYYTAGVGGAFNGALTEGEQYYRLRERVSSGSFDTTSSAIYLQDTWQATDDIVLTLGLRNETFDNKNIAGESFIKMTSQWAPRLGASWDVNGDGESKLFAHFGRYYLPVAANTNLRLAGAELFTQRYFALDGLDANFIPTNDHYAEVKGTITDIAGQLSTTKVFNNGQVADTRSLVDANIEPMYQDELIVGYQTQVTDEWAVRVRATYRNLATTIEDIYIDAGLQRYADANSGADLDLGGSTYPVLTNPGANMSLMVDADGNGELDNITLTAEQLGYPGAKRQYVSIDFILDRAWDDVWMLSGSYTWSHNWGNSEGSVRSDNGQEDAGLTTNFDQPGLTEGASGHLPNDRRHQVKFYGGYAVTENLLVGANFNWQTGRPRNAFGFHPTDKFAQNLGSESFFSNGKLIPRGSLGTQPSYWNLDVNTKYFMEINGADVTFALDVFNILDNDTIRQSYEIADSEDSGQFEGVGNHPADPYFGLADDHQSPRFVRLSAAVRF